MGDKETSDLNAFHDSVVWVFVSSLERTPAVKVCVFPSWRPSAQLSLGGVTAWRAGWQLLTEMQLKI